MIQWSRMVGGMASAIGTVVLKTGLNILLIPVIIRMLGVEEYSLYVLLVAALELFLLMEAGFNSGTIKLLGGYRSRGETERGFEVLGLSNLFFGSMSLLLFVAGMAMIPIFPHFFNIPIALQDTAQMCLAIIVTEASITLYTILFDSIVQADYKNQWLNVAEVTYYGIGNGLGLILLLSGHGIVSLLLARLFACLIKSSIIAYHAFKTEPDLLRIYRTRVKFREFKELFRNSGHAMTLSICVQVSHGIDGLVIAKFLPLASVGVFEIVFRLLGLAMQIPYKMCLILFPIFGRISAMEAHDQAKKLFLRMSFLSGYLSTLLLILILTYYNELFHLFAGDKIPIKETYPILAIAAVSIWASAFIYPTRHYLYNDKGQKFLTISSVITAFSNLVLSLILVHPFGIVGVALGTVIPQVIQYKFFLIRRTCRDLNISLREYSAQVHFKMLLPILTALVFMETFRWAGPFFIHPLIDFLVASLLATGLSVLVWYACSASPEEKQLAAKAFTIVTKRLPGTNNVTEPAEISSSS